MTAFRKYFNLILVTAVFAALLMLFKFGVVEPAYTPISENPCLYGEMFGPVSCLKNWVYGGLILAWGIALYFTIRKRCKMRWKDFLTTEYKKLDITLEKASDVQFLSLLHDAYFDPAEIRYARKRLVIPIKDRTTWEWTPGNDRMPGGEVDGELILYPVADPWDWLLTLSGAQFTDENQMHNIEISKISLKKKKDDDGNPFYHFKMAFPTFDLPRALDVALRSGDDFPLIRYKDKTTPKDWSEQ